jgi:hypothetical protein
VTITLPLDDGTFEAVCDRCAWTFSLASEEVLGTLTRQHDERHAEKDRLAASLRRAELLVPRYFRSLHVHGQACTFEVCGVGPTHADLIAESKARR